VTTEVATLAGVVISKRRCPIEIEKGASGLPGDR